MLVITTPSPSGRAVDPTPHSYPAELASPGRWQPRSLPLPWNRPFDPAPDGARTRIGSSCDCHILCCAALSGEAVGSAAQGQAMTAAGSRRGLLRPQSRLPGRKLCNSIMPVFDASCRLYSSRLTAGLPVMPRVVCTDKRTIRNHAFPWRHVNFHLSQLRSPPRDLSPMSLTGEMNWQGTMGKLHA